MRKSDFIAIFILNIILFVLIALGDFGAGNFLGLLRIVLGFVYLLFVPGYALQAALFPRTIHLALLDRFAFSLGLSIALTPILGLVLDGPPGGIFLWQSFIFLTSVTVICSLVAIYRRSRLTRDEINADETELDLRGWWKSQNSFGRVLFALIPLSVVIGIVLIAYVLPAASPDKQFTEFYVLGTSGVAANYPIEVKAGQPFILKVGVTNHEGNDITYSIQAHMNGQTVAGTAPFNLNDGQSISLDVSLAGSTPGNQQLLEILLLRDNQIYRRLYLWLDVKAP